MDPMPDWLVEVITPLPTDSSDLRWAVETVATMWARGDRKKSLLWLKQAVETARGDGQDDRAGVLAQAVMEFERLRPPVPAPGSSSSSSLSARPVNTTQPVHASAPGTPGAGSDPPRAHRSVPPTAPYRIPPDAATHVSAPASDVLSALRRPDPDLDQPPIEHAPTYAEAAERPGPLESTAIMNADGFPVSMSAPPTLETPIVALEPMRARRIAVRHGSGRDLVVTLLDDDEPAPQGTQEALLVAVRSAARQ